MDVNRLIYSIKKKLPKQLSAKILATSLLISLLACNSNDGQLEGGWVSSKSRTLEEISKTMTLSERHQRVIGNITGKIKHTIIGDSWLSEYEGTPTESSFVVLSRTDNCYQLLFDSSDKVKACLYGEELHLPSGIDNIIEVFVKK